MSNNILTLLEERRSKFDFSAALYLFETRKEIVFKSSSGGVADWKYPAERNLDWNNPLTGIYNHNCEFNFVFKSGSSNAPMSGQADPVVYINPSDSVVKRILIHYD